MIRYLLLFVLISTIIAETFRIPFFAGGITFVDLFSAILFFVWIIKTLLIDRNIKFFQGFIPLMCFIIFGAISLVWNIGELQLDISESINSLSYLVRYFFLSGLIIISFNLNNKDKSFVLNSIFITSLIIFVLGLLQLKFFPSFEKLGMDNFGWDPHIGRMLSTWFDPNYLGGYFAFVISLGVGVLYDELTKSQKLKFEDFKNEKLGLNLQNGTNKKSGKIPAFAGMTEGWITSSSSAGSDSSQGHKYPFTFYLLPFTLFFLLVGIILTYSRSALLALIVSFFILGLFLSKRMLFIGFIILILGIGVSDRMQERFFSGLESAQALFISSEKALDPTAKLRMQSWNAGIEIFKENPIIGIGFNTLKYEQKKKWAKMSESHGSSGIDSSVLTVMATTGIFGLITFVLFWFFVLKNALMNFIKNNDGYALGLFAGICGLLIHSIFVNSLFFYALLPTVFIGIGLIGRKS